MMKLGNILLEETYKMFRTYMYIEFDDANMDDGSIIVRKGKGNRPRVVTIGNKAQKALWKCTLYRKGNSNRLFLNRSGEHYNFFEVAIF